MEAAQNNSSNSDFMIELKTIGGGSGSGSAKPNSTTSARGSSSSNNSNGRKNSSGGLSSHPLFNLMLSTGGASPDGGCNKHSEEFSLGRSFSAGWRLGDGCSDGGGDSGGEDDDDEDDGGQGDGLRMPARHHLRKMHTSSMLRHTMSVEDLAAVAELASIVSAVHLTAAASHASLV
eukprot:CAMPEP_0202863694 /NCGR_PEP_ID=MMETSP1391-20130828/4229_1 /ASSEMBLY_ACC=CAM_ASM_000867 /TAXON_ID=1034604 /ORGANISM="Chlamydomonas leiostraca, Strain SAG 11-49" /LENGTH=175 /DNA_ID=CAMNT_0049543353 /DNA_START=139 /DNA_END=662 /DNA_ORIENTATION=-